MKKILIKVSSVVILGSSLGISSTAVLSQKVRASSIDAIKVNTKNNRQAAIVQELKNLYPELSESYLNELVQRQANNDYELPSLRSHSSYTKSDFLFGSSKTSWKGITVSQMGAAIDAAIIGASGGSVSAGVKVALKKIGKKKAKAIIRKVVTGAIGGAAGKITANVISKALDCAGSPGYYIAKYWDAHDKYPNNGRINF